MTVYFLVHRQRIGMVWASIAAALLALVLLLVRRPVGLPLMLAVSVLLPFALYGFFYHIARVPIPQGRYVILP